MFQNPFRSRAGTAAGPVEFLVAGLGNPGRQYENSRHNAGFLTLDYLAEQAGARVDRIKFKGLCGDAIIGGRRALLLKPSTFMNLSGQSVLEAMRFYKLPPERAIIIFDDISLAPGRLRIRRKGSDGGHNGMKNIIYLSGKDTFPRIKMGIGAKPEGWDLADWVLSSFSRQERAALDEAIRCAAAAVALMAAGNIDEAMNRYNS